VGDACRHFSHSREALLQGGVALQLLDLRDVLKTEQKAGPAARRFKMGRADTQFNLSPPIPGLEVKLTTTPGGMRHVVIEPASNLRRQL
jgi:hypothetical protein